VGAFCTSTAVVDAAQVGDWAFPSGRARWLPDQPEDLRSVGRFIGELDLPAATVAAIDEVLARADVDTGSLPSGFIHGDVSPLNAIWNAGIATLIDLDEMRWGYRLFDAVQGVATVAGFDPGPAARIVRTRWELGRAHAFLTGWSHEVRPTTAEVRAFDVFLKLTLVRVVVGELNLDDPALPTRPDAAESIAALLSLLRAPAPALAAAKK
jgi:Ser/Thr protein kinase RdoA (MazF antagonist)